MNSDEIALGILKAAMMLAVGYAAFRFFSDYPLLLIPLAVVGAVVGIVSSAVKAVKDVGIVRTALVTALGLIMMGAFVSFGWGIYSNIYDGQSTYSKIAIGYGLIVMIVGSAIADWQKERALKKKRAIETARARVS